MERMPGKAIEPPFSESTLLFWIFIALLLLQSLARVRDPGYWQELYRSLLNLNYVSLLMREGKLRWSPANIILDLVFLFSIAFYLQQVLTLTEVQIAFWKVFLMAGGVIGTQLLLALFMGHLFYTLQHIHPFLMNMVVFNRVLGVFLLPMLVVTTYAEVLPKALWLTAVGGLCASFLIFRAIRALIQMQGMLQHGIIYNFCYLWIIELAPLIIVIDRVLALF